MLTTASVPEVPPSLSAGPWVADLLMGEPTLRVDRPRLTINTHGVVFGSGGLNHFVGAAKVDSERISLSILSAKQFLCPAPVADQEETFMRALAAARSYAVDDDHFYLFDELGTTVVRFEHLPNSNRDFLSVNQ